MPMPSTYICSKGAVQTDTQASWSIASRQAQPRLALPACSAMTAQFPLTTWPTSQATVCRYFAFHSDGREMRTRTATSRRRPGFSSGSTETLSRPNASAPKRKSPPEGKRPPCKPHAEERKSTTPLYLQLAGKLIYGIQSRRFPVGSLLPCEIELSAIHKVSRQTVRLQ